MEKWRSAAAKRIKKLGGGQSVEDPIISLVERLLTGVTCPPTDLDEVMRRLNIVGCELDHDMVVPGEIRQTSNGLKIYLIPGLAKGRRRFTIAHELGHAIFESTGRGRPRSGKELERLCDKIAAELLMPTKIFRKQASINPTLDHLMELADLFQTSITATFRRASELCGIRAFEVEDGTLNWSAGISRVWLGRASSTLHESIQKAMNGESGKGCVVFYFGAGYTKWDMEWRCVAQGKRAFFILTPSNNAVWSRSNVSA